VEYVFGDCLIQLCTAHGENPKKLGSKCFDRFEKMKARLNGGICSVANLRNSGYTMEDLRWDALHGFHPRHLVNRGSAGVRESPSLRSGSARCGAAR
jgi:hypothetical protein